MRQRTQTRFGCCSSSDLVVVEPGGGRQRLAETEPLRTRGDVVLGVDIGGTKTALLAWALTTDAVLAQDVFPTPTEIGPEAMVDRLRAAIDTLLADCGHEQANLFGIGVAVPG